MNSIQTLLEIVKWADYFVSGGPRPGTSPGGEPINPNNVLASMSELIKIQKSEIDKLTRKLELSEMGHTQQSTENALLMSEVSAARAKITLLQEEAYERDAQLHKVTRERNCAIDFLPEGRLEEALNRIVAAGRGLLPSVVETDDTRPEIAPLIKTEVKIITKGE